jgi:membrane-bound lytic murein transglycosylase B
MPTSSSLIRRRPSRRVTIGLALSAVAAMTALPLAVAGAHTDNRLQPVSAAYAAETAGPATPAAEQPDVDGSTLTAKLARDAPLRKTLRSLQSEVATTETGGGAAASSAVVAGGSVADIPAIALSAYRNAAAKQSIVDPSCHVPWSLLAGIGRVESSHGRYGGSRPDASGVVHPAILGPVLDGSGGNAAISDTDAGKYDADTRWDRAVGPMQFIPSTWATSGRDGDGDGIRDPENLFDAALSAANYLCASGGDLRTADAANRAVLSYNHSWDYVLVVRGYAASYARQDLSAVIAGVAAHATTARRTVAGKGLAGKGLTKPTAAAHSTPTRRPTSKPAAPVTSRPSTPLKPSAPAPTRSASASSPTVTVSPTQSPTQSPTATPSPTLTPTPSASPTSDARSADAVAGQS